MYYEYPTSLSPISVSLVQAASSAINIALVSLIGQPPNGHMEKDIRMETRFSQSRALRLISNHWNFLVGQNFTQ